MKEGVSNDAETSLGRSNNRFKDGWFSNEVRSKELILDNSVATNGYTSTRSPCGRAVVISMAGISGSRLNYITDANHVFFEDTTERMH